VKKIIFCALALLCSLALGATLSPVQLLNPTGSTAGQAIVSNGPSSAPTWQNVSFSTLSGVVPIASGGTGATSAAAALSNLGGLSTTTAASTYLTQSNAASTYLTQSNATSTYATITNLALKSPIASPTFTGTVTIPTGASITKPNIVGTATNDSAAAGNVGEYLTNTTSGTSMTTNVAMNSTSLASVAAGDYDVQCVNTYVMAGTTTATSVGLGVSTTSATFGATGSVISTVASISAGQGNPIIASPVVRVSLAAPTTIYCVANATFAVSTMTATGFIRARRVR
jgi:hypothetical protein